MTLSGPKISAGSPQFGGGKVAKTLEILGANQHLSEFHQAKFRLRNWRSHNLYTHFKSQKIYANFPVKTQRLVGKNHREMNQPINPSLR